MSNVKKYTSNPVEIEAMQRTGDPNTDSELIQWIVDEGGQYDFICPESGCSSIVVDPDGTRGSKDPHILKIETMEGTMDVPVGWWVIRGTIGEFYPCKDEVFQAKYRVSDED